MEAATQSPGAQAHVYQAANYLYCGRLDRVVSFVYGGEMTQPEQHPEDVAPHRLPEREAPPSLRVIGLLLGAGIAGTLDEVILHQLLQWHNFYVHTSEAGRIVSDGLFHLTSSALLLVGTLLLWRRRHAARKPNDGRRLGGTILVGLGGFNLYDGTIQHKLLRLHQVREGVANALPYDLGFLAIALAVLGAGWVLLRAARQSP